MASDLNAKDRDADGGTKCSEQLKQVAGAVKLRLVSTAPALVLPDAVIREGAVLDPNRDFSNHLMAVRNAITELADLLIYDAAFGETGRALYSSRGFPP